VEITYLEENKRLGTAGALGLIEEELEEPLFVINGDILTTVSYADLLKFHHDKGADMTLCVRTYDYQIPYGVVVSDKNTVVSLEEKPFYSYSVNAGIYLIRPSLLKYIPRNDFCDITDFIALLLEKNYKVCSYEISDYWLDIGRVEDYQKAQDDMRY
jgi:NDP-sugar pyrophosphorylase family protein